MGGGERPCIEAMYAECKTWEKPFVKVPKVDVKEGDAAAAAAADDDTTGDAADDAAATGGAAGGDAPAAAGEVAELTPELLGMEFKVGKVLSAKKHPEAEKLYIEEVGSSRPFATHALLLIFFK